MREYRAYISRGYVIWAHIIFPVFAIVFGNFIGLSGEAGFIVSFAIALSGELLFDGFGFGPVCLKHGAGTKLMQASFYGESFFKKLIIQDSIIRIVKLTLVMLVSAITFQRIHGIQLSFLFALAFMFLVVQLGILIARHISVMIFSFFFSSLWASLGLIGYILVLVFAEEYLLAATIISAVLTVVAIIFSAKYTSNCYKKGFVD